MANCSPDETDISGQKLGAKFGLSIITIIYVIFLIFIVFVILSVKRANTVASSQPTIKKEKKAAGQSYYAQFKETLSQIKEQLNSLVKKGEHSRENFFDRFADWFTEMGSSINSGSVLAILAAGIVIGFNGLIMTPLIQTIFPIDISQSMEIPGRNVAINPGQFLIALIGFILSLILFFFIAEIFGLIHKYAKTGLIVFVLVVLFAFLTTMLGINIHIASQILPLNDCVPYDTSIPTYQIRNVGTKANALNSEQKSTNSLPLFGVFG